MLRVAAGALAGQSRRLRHPGEVRGQPQHGHTGEFELICCERGDNPHLDYSQISPRLQQIRGPYTIAEGLAAYERHLGLTCDCPG
jgi:hypothetical protein